MQSWIHVLEWRATVRPGVTALVDDRGAEYSYAALRAELERRAGGWAGLGPAPVTSSRSWPRTARTSSCTRSR